MAGRIESYVHSDSTTENKGAVIIKLTTDSDFAARTAEFKAFAKQAAMMAFGALGHMRLFLAAQDGWTMIIAKFPDLEDQRRALERELREAVQITQVTVLRL